MRKRPRSAPLLLNKQKTTSILKEPSVERNFELRRSAKFSSRESSVLKSGDETKSDQIESATISEQDKLHTLRYSSGGVLSTKSAQTLPAAAAESLSLNPPSSSDLPYIDEDERELDEAIRDATGLAQEEVVASIQLGTTSAVPDSTAATLLVTHRSCSGTDTIHMSEKVIKRDYRDL